jgi:hypothetical protein
MDADDGSEFPSFRVNFPGPFTHHDVMVNGWRVPLVRAHPQGDDQVLLVLDERFGLELSLTEAERVVPFVADAIAVALGFTAHPSHDDDAPNKAPHPRPERIHTVVGFEPPD